MSHTINITCNVISDGGSPITSRGIVYNTCQFPTIDDNKIQATGTTEPFSATITGVTGGYTYYIRPYAINSSGVAYGVQNTVLTPQPTIAIVHTLSADTITQTGATIYSNVTDDGNSLVTNRGIVYSNSINPTYSPNSKNTYSDISIRNGSGVGLFTTNIVGLTQTPGQNVYVKSYAINGVDIAYSNQIAIQIPATIPSVIINSITINDVNSALVSGNITYNGGSEILKKGICWSTTTNPISGITNTVISPNNNNSLIEYMTELISPTTYYVRLFAINSVGISYSDNFTYSHIYNPGSTPTKVFLTLLYNSGEDSIYVTATDKDPNPITNPNNYADAIQTNVNIQITCNVSYNSSKYGYRNTRTLYINNGSSSSTTTMLTDVSTIPNMSLSITPLSYLNYKYINNGVMDGNFLI